jgi:predicted TIM-barrel fold metal-dependent hydrolase
MTDPIVDAHHHIWRLSETPWLNGPPVPRIFGEYPALRRDYLAADYAGDARPCGVYQSVYVQINVAAGREIEEVEWVQSCADTHGFPHAIIGYADLGSYDLDEMLDRQTRCANFRGIRQQLHWHSNPAYRFAIRPDLMTDERWQRGLAKLSERGLLFELQVFASQMADAARLAANHPQQTFILLHAGMLEDTSAQGWSLWRAGMRQLAARPNVMVKLSGLGTFSHACSVALWQPIVRETLDMFGPERAVFGSNFPIESLWTSYAQIVDVMRECVAGRPATERRAIFGDNARRIYRILD